MIPLKATFDVLSVYLLLVPFVGFLALGLQILNASESRNLKCELYKCALSAVYLSSVFGGYPDTDMQMRGPQQRYRLSISTPNLYIQETQIYNR